MADALVYRQETTKRGKWRVKVETVHVQQIPSYVRSGWTLLIDSRDFDIDDVRRDDESGRRG
jgi:hypothetical protein